MKVIVTGAGWKEEVETDEDPNGENFLMDCMVAGLKQSVATGSGGMMGLIMSFKEKGAEDSEERWVLSEHIMDYMEDRESAKILREARENL